MLHHHVAIRKPALRYSAASMAKSLQSRYEHGSPSIEISNSVREFFVVWACLESAAGSIGLPGVMLGIGGLNHGHWERVRVVCAGRRSSLLLRLWQYPLRAQGTRKKSSDVSMSRQAPKSFRMTPEKVEAGSETFADRRSSPAQSCQVPQLGVEIDVARKSHPKISMCSDGASPYSTTLMFTVPT